MSATANLDAPLDKPANRRRFLNQVARGHDHAESAEAIGTTIRTVQRYSKTNAAFKARFKDAKRQGLDLRRDADRAAAAAEREREGIKELEQSAAEGAPQAYLEEMELAQPGGLKLNSHLPDLSVQSHLGMCQRFAYDKSEHPVIRREAMRQIGMHTLLPALRPPPAPSRNETGTVAEAQQPALAIPGAGPRVVVLVAPDNGMYAPGCGPGQATVVDEAEAADAELVTAAK